MKHDAVTLDTQTVQQHGFLFDEGLLAQLKQFATGPIRVIISQVVVDEVTRHLAEHITKIRDTALKAERDASRHKLPHCKHSEALATTDPSAHATMLVSAFLASVAAVIIPFDKVPARTIMALHSRREPPFSVGKKSEFPDAYALLSLDAWARTKRKSVLAVSKDSDWQSFAAGSPRIDTMPELSAALSSLQSDIDLATAALSPLLERLNVDGSSSHVRVEQVLREALENATVYGEASSPAFYIEMDHVSATLSEFTFDLDRSHIVRANALATVFSIPTSLVVDAEGAFSFDAYDSIDRDYVGMGSTTAYQEGELVDVEILVTVAHQAEYKRPRVSKIEVILPIITIDFGSLSPDWWGEDDHEYI